MFLRNNRATFRFVLFCSGYVSTVEGVKDVVDIAFDGAGNLYGVQSQKIVRLDQPTVLLAV
jgi:hypothetical protein